VTNIDVDPRPDPRALAALVLEADTEASVDADAVSDEPVPVVVPAGPPTALGSVITRGGRATIGVLLGLAVLDSTDNSMFTLLAPDIRRSLHTSTTLITFIGALAGVTVTIAAIPLGALGDRVRRTWIAGASAVVWSVAAVLTGIVGAAWQMVGIRTLSGLGKANEGPIHTSILTDAYPPEGRGRIFGIRQGGLPLGIMIGPAIGGLVASIVGGPNGWRWAFPILAIPGVLLGLAAMRLPEPRRGRFEQEEILGGELPADANALPVSISAAFARLKKVKTFYFIMAALGAFGLSVTTVPIYLSIILNDRFSVSVGHRGALGAIGAIGAVIGAVVGGKYSDQLFRKSPERCMWLAGGALVALGIGFALQAYSPNIPFFLIVGIITQALLFAGLVPLSLIVSGVTPFEFRSTGFALVGLYLSFVGGLGGAAGLAILSNAYGDRAAIAILAPLASVAAAIILGYASRFVRSDMAAAAAEVVEERDERIRIAHGGEVPLLQVRHLDFSYGRVQVLFDVSMDVNEGEVLALLGTNGAGKSTLLRAISGLDFADRGRIQLGGRTITFGDPASRVNLGIVQVPGGKSVYPTLSVADNLLIGGYTLLRDHEGLQVRVDAALEHFPVLAERLDQPAGTLSGGEQQMLGLATAMILQPKILLIDELSLGLAPVMVQQVLNTVEGLKAQGLTMVIVEQSINVALSIADRAVFMEKGQVKFQGPAADLLERDDLVRAVFLGGEGG
jgi:ABC-type branched-subunit amino acid transport system ATPase component/predicted MFS family arabinose efflux permease